MRLLVILYTWNITCTNHVRIVETNVAFFYHPLFIFIDFFILFPSLEIINKSSSPERRYVWIITTNNSLLIFFQLIFVQIVINCVKQHEKRSSAFVGLCEISYGDHTLALVLLREIYSYVSFMSLSNSWYVNSKFYGNKYVTCFSKDCFHLALLVFACGHRITVDPQMYVWNTVL